MSRDTYFCKECPISSLFNSLVVAIERPGPTTPNRHILDAAKKVAAPENPNNCHICLPVVLAEGPLIPMIERIEDIAKNDWDFETDARSMRDEISFHMKGPTE